ncbi:MAG: ribonuclease HII [Anaerolineales bacterium]|nr:ribonuclease HII [Anaerolineales bacterium]
MTHADPAVHGPNLTYEYALRDTGCALIAGLDEAGRGAWAGPVVAAAVMLPIQRFDLAQILVGVRDSKRMTPLQRETWYARIFDVALAIGVGEASAHEIDEAGLIASTRLAMLRALDKLKIKPQHLLLDHIRLPQQELPQTPITRGDGCTLTIAAASVVAKVARDRAMIANEAMYPGYGFAQHKGYGTRFHHQALQQLGPCPIHRKSYAPVAAQCLTED